MARDSTITNFIAKVKSDGLARSNRFAVEFSLPQTIIPYGGQHNNKNLRDILLFCDTAQLPGINFSTTQSRTFGEFREIPYEKLFDPITLSFYVDTKLNVKQLFDTWTETIQDPFKKTFNYYNYYTTNLDIYVLDVNNKVKYKCKLFEAYPKTVAAIALDQAAKDVMRLNVTMQYRNYATSSFEDELSGNSIISVPSDYYYNNKQFQGKFNDFNNVFQNNAEQTNTQNVDGGYGGTTSFS